MEQVTYATEHFRLTVNYIQSSYDFLHLDNGLQSQDTTRHNPCVHLQSRKPGVFDAQIFVSLIKRK